MGLTKVDQFTEVQNKMALIAKALGHPARIAILEHLWKVDSCICGQLVDTLPLAQATISQHLKELKNAGLIKGTIEGTSICYCLDKQNIEILMSYLHCFTQSKSLNLTNCCK